jgi:hypothetical protein
VATYGVSSAEEMDGGMEAKERSVVRMQGPANLFFALKEKETPSMTVQDIIDTHTHIEGQTITGFWLRQY